MRVVSRFHDYYDSVMNTGMDREIVYLREPSQTEIKLKDIDFSTNQTYKSHILNLVLLGYCGTFYKIYVVEIQNTKTKHIFHNYDEFKKFMLLNKFADKYDFDEGRWWRNDFQKFRDFDPKSLNEFFHDLQVPIFVIQHTKSYRNSKNSLAILNPCLKDLEFYKIKDAYTAYQDIFQFVAGVLNRPENKMVQISDQDKIDKHGFDKWSFRQKGPKKPTAKK